MTPAEIAEVTHAANRVYQAHIGDAVAPRWDKASPNHQLSVINGVEHAQEFPDLTAQDSHENWLKFKRGDGWVYGETKDEVNKTHPCLVEWDDLPAADQGKDKLFLGIVRALS